MKALPICLIVICLTACSSVNGSSNSSYTEITSETTAAVSTVSTASTQKTSAVKETTAETSAEAVIETMTEEPAELPDEVLIDTGTFSQYNCTLAGDTACGATAGTLILQSISYVSGDELTERMEIIRGYSALSDEYSCGAPQYYLCGFQISNSLNKYLDDNGFDGYRLTDHRNDKSTEKTLMELISTGRPAVLEVCYGNGEVLRDFGGYSHWICVNGYRVTANGVEFRYSDTIIAAEKWVGSELLDESNANVSYGDFYLQPERYICSFETAVTVR